VLVGLGLAAPRAAPYARMEATFAGEATVGTKILTRSTPPHVRGDDVVDPRDVVSTKSIDHGLILPRPTRGPCSQVEGDHIVDDVIADPARLKHFDVAVLDAAIVIPWSP
jgi:hypothetical protein